ncbi:hypothetical protein IFR05_015806 [Cadophora sp. M221]|nr:hypothetical protein IFR05_015806 [Cadophora sp. M221]
MSQANSDILDTQSLSFGLVFRVLLLFVALLGTVQVKRFLLARDVAAAAAAPAPVPWDILLLQMEPGAVVRRHTLPARLPLARLQRTIVADEEARIEGSSRIVNLAVGGLMIVGAAFHLHLTISAIVTAVYIIIFGLATVLLEFQIPPQVARYASFLFSFVGRGVFYIFVGSLLLADGVMDIIIGTIIGVIGVAYVVLEFVPSIEPPQNMREADGGWGAEQV